MEVQTHVRNFVPANMSETPSQPKSNEHINLRVVAPVRFIHGT